MSTGRKATQLPDDVEALKELVAQREATLAQREATLAQREATLAQREATLAEQETAIAEREATIAHLEHRVELLTRELFAPSSEKRSRGSDEGEHPRQGHFLFPELLAAAQRVADEQGVPPYVVFGDATLVELARLERLAQQGANGRFLLGAELVPGNGAGAAVQGDGDGCGARRRHAALTASHSEGQQQAEEQGAIAG